MKKQFKTIFYENNDENPLFDKIKANIILNLCILSKTQIFQNYLLENLSKNEAFLEKLCKVLIESKSSTKLKQNFQLLMISIFFSIKDSKESTKFIDVCLIRNLSNFNLNYQTNASLLIISCHIILLLLSSEKIAMKIELFEALLQQILLYNSHHFHTVKITTQTLIVSIWCNENIKSKLLKIVKNEALFYQFDMITNFVMNNKELSSIVSSNKILKTVNLDEERDVRNLILQLEEGSNYCNIFAKYQKSKKFSMALYENIKKTIDNVLDFSSKPDAKTNEKEGAFQNRNKVAGIHDFFHEIKSENQQNSNDCGFELIVIASYLDNLPNIAGILF